MPYYLLIAVCCAALFYAGTPAHAQGQQKLEYDQDSRVWVEGTSTIHDWSCEAPAVSGSLTIPADSDRPLTNVQRTQLIVPVEQLDCGKDKMNRKLREAFKMDDHPEISFEARQISVGDVSVGSGPALPLVAIGELTMAGTTRTVEVTAEGYEEAGNRLKFTGQHELDMSDYGMNPPTALLGTIRTDENVVVHFEVWAGSQ